VGHLVPSVGDVEEVPGEEERDDEADGTADDDVGNWWVVVNTGDTWVWVEDLHKDVENSTEELDVDTELHDEDNLLGGLGVVTLEPFEPDESTVGTPEAGDDGVDQEQNGEDQTGAQELKSVQNSEDEAEDGEDSAEDTEDGQDLHTKADLKDEAAFAVFLLQVTLHFLKVVVTHIFFLFFVKKL